MEAKARPRLGMALAARLVGACVLVAVIPLIASTLIVVWPTSGASNVSPVTAAALLGGSLVVALGAGLTLAFHYGRRLSALQRAMNSAAAGDYAHQNLSEVDDEFAALAGSFRDMVASFSQRQSMDAARSRELRESLRQREADIDTLSQDNTRLRAETHHKKRSVATLQEFSRTVSTTPGIARVCGHLISALSNQLNVDLAYVALLKGPVAGLIPVAVLDRSKGTGLATTESRELPSLDRLMGHDLALEILSGSHISRSSVPGKGGAVEATMHLLGLPMKVQDKMIGVAVVAGKQSLAYSREDERLAGTVAEQAALAIANIRLLEEARQLETLRELDRLKSELISNVSHELRTPLASIKGYIGTLLRSDVTWDEDSKRDFLQIAEDETDRLQTLIDNLLQMSRIEAGVLHIHKERVQLLRLAQKIARKFRLREERQRIAVSFADDFPEVWADPAQMEQVLNNLLENAVKYSPPTGRITVRAEAVDGRAKVSVSDEGMGIAADHIGHIFDRFYRADTPEVKRIGGTGLGLSICKGIIEAHGGKMFAESTPGRGSTFGFELPVDQPEGAHESVTDMPRQSDLTLPVGVGHGARA